MCDIRSIRSKIACKEQYVWLVGHLPQGQQWNVHLKGVCLLGGRLDREFHVYPGGNTDDIVFNSPGNEIEKPSSVQLVRGMLKLTHDQYSAVRSWPGMTTEQRQNANLANG